MYVTKAQIISAGGGGLLNYHGGNYHKALRDAYPELSRCNFGLNMKSGPSDQITRRNAKRRLDQG